MAVNIGDAENALLEAQALFETWYMEFMRDWYEPMTRQMMAAVWAGVPDEVKAQLDAADVEAMEKYVRGEL